MTPNYPVIITDGLWRKSLSAIRALGKSGYKVHVIGSSVFTTGFWSRFTHQWKVAPLASDDAKAFGTELVRYLAAFPKQTPPVLLPMEDASMKWVSENRAALAELVRFALPSENSVEIALDKSLTIRLAADLGIPVPKTFWPENPKQAAEQIRANLSSIEWVIKPISGSGSKGIFYGSCKSLNDAQLDELLELHWNEHGPILVQERIPSTGRGVGASFLLDGKGGVLAEFLHERIHQYPISGGPSTDRVSIHHTQIREESLKLLRALEWKGVAMVEWKTDPRDGSFKLMEINPRFWGSLELAVRAGVDFPTLYAELSLGLPQKASPPVYADGVRCRWMIPGEILRYLSTPRSARESLFKFLKGLPKLAEEWDARDLRGAFATLICTFALALNPKYWKYVRRG